MKNKALFKALSLRYFLKKCGAKRRLGLLANDEDVGAHALIRDEAVPERPGQN